MPDTSPPTSDPRIVWEERYGSTTEFLYGTEPNDFLAATAPTLTAGDTLCLADGEGRNGVYLAGLGHRVTSVDLTKAGMAKAAALATERGVSLTTVVADLADYDLGTERWDVVVSIFAHTPPPIRRRVHGALATALRPGGTLILEAYTPDQIGRGTGGPPVPELTMDLARLDKELVGLEFEHRAECIRPVIEGPGHTGDGAVVQVIARRPG
ncbi:MAG: methyltransferase domain-containing protein [Acidimicrobiales bacterium]